MIRESHFIDHSQVRLLESDDRERRNISEDEKREGD